jgi:sulfatase maturation enzyme AslB (radical SAM superfamily)
VIESYRGCSKSVYAPTEKQKHEILSAFSKIAKENKIQIEMCADSGDWSQYGIIPSKCIDGEIFEKLLNAKRKDNKLDGQRKHCGCMPAVDIGQYDTCRHGCNYCYARKGKPKSMTDKLNGDIYERKAEIVFDYLS